MVIAIGALRKERKMWNNHHKEWKREMESNSFQPLTIGISSFFNMSSRLANGIWNRGVCCLDLLVCFHFYSICSYFLRVLIFPGQREMKDVYWNHFQKLPLVRSAPSILVRPDSRALDRLLPKHEAIIMIFICISKKTLSICQNQMDSTFILMR